MGGPRRSPHRRHRNRTTTTLNPFAPSSPPDNRGIRRFRGVGRRTMANLNTAIDSAFWDQNISTPQTLDGTARSVPGEPFPIDGSRASRAHRIQQLSLLREGFPLGIIPSLAPASDKKLGSFSLHSLLLSPSSSDWWLGLVGQFRPKKLISDIRAEITNAEEWDLQVVKDTAKHIIDKSLYSIGMWAQFALGSSSSLLLSTERQGDKNGFRNKLTFVHPLEEHDVTLEAAWPELFVDHKGRYWDVPESISFDVSSLVPDSGLRYRFGLHSNRGQPRAVNDADGDAPPALMPGLCSKAAVSYKMSRDFWRQKEGEDDGTTNTEDDDFDVPSYDERLKEPHAAISGIIGGSFAAWITGRDKRRSPISADLFSSVCYTFQKGQFRKYYRDLTRVDARVDICSASALAKRVFQTLTRSSADAADDSLWSPRLKLIFMQQVAGPIVFRVDSQFQVGAGKYGARMEDVMLSLNYSLRLLESGKVVAWYSPKRKEGMIEVRVLEF
ncbi:PREDICTED: protein TRIGALACTOSYLDIACYLGLYCEROL 4, chloroplastic [Tarenaya hassleriana]|uniref:protein TRIGALACTOSYLDIACYLGLYCEROL 4, chloroplastic n=1 Tax=Tarenaya hassleriana TaxID=28532 RepID=UPI00053C8F72|nr:PREDICTED: protein TRIGALACTOSYLDIACYLGLYCEROL 4, chloroplastic [Tarenaya hassleriana]